MIVKKIIHFIGYSLWLIVAIFLLIALADYACRFIFPAWAPIEQVRSTWMYDADLGWSQKPNVDTSVKYPALDISISIKTNHYGLRDKEYSLERTDKKRMLVLGDSFVWGYGVEDQERFTEILEKRYPDWEIINAGTSGYGTDQEYLYYIKQGYKFKPDVVLLLFYFNDFENNYRDEEYHYYKPFFTLDKSGALLSHNLPVPPSTFSQVMNRYMETQTIVWVKLRDLCYMINYGVTHLFVKDTEPFMFAFSHYPESFPITNALLTQLKNTVAANHSEFIVFALPERRGLKQDLDNLTNSGDWNYLDMDPFFAGKEKETIIPHDLHWNATGHRMAADIMEDYLRKKGIFK